MYQLTKSLEDRLNIREMLSKVRKNSSLNTSFEWWKKCEIFITRLKVFLEFGKFVQCQKKVTEETTVLRRSQNWKFFQMNFFLFRSQSLILHFWEFLSESCCIVRVSEQFWPRGPWDHNTMCSPFSWGQTLTERIWGGNDPREMEGLEGLHSGRLSSTCRGWWCWSAHQVIRASQPSKRKDYRHLASSIWKKNLIWFRNNTSTSTADQEY